MFHRYIRPSHSRPQFTSRYTRDGRTYYGRTSRAGADRYVSSCRAEGGTIRLHRFGTETTFFDGRVIRVLGYWPYGLRQQDIDRMISVSESLPDDGLSWGMAA